MPPREQAKEKPKAYYLKLGSGSEQVVGECQDRYHVSWIELRSFQYEASRGSSTGTGAGRTVTSRIAVDKRVDRTSSQLFVAATQGKAFTSAVIEIADEDTGIPRFRLSLTGVLLEYSGASGPSLGGSGQIESFVLDFANA